MATPASGPVVSAYSTMRGHHGQTRIAQGTVIRYDSLDKLYTVNVDGDATRICRRLHTGVDSPPVPGTRVLLLKNYGVDWIVLGELEKATIPVPPDGGSADDQAAQQERDFNANPNQFPEVGFRQVDSDGVPEAPRIPGDLVLENRAEKHVSRASIKIHSFGDIYVQTSRLCYEHFHKKRNTITRRARDLITRALGYKKEILTATDQANNGKSTLDEQMSALSTDTTPIMRRIVGTIPARPTQADKSFAATPIVTAGERMEHGGFLVVEKDAVTETVRFEHKVGGTTFLTGAIGGLKNSDVLIPSSLSSSSGLGLKFGNFEITYDSESNKLEIVSTAKLSSKLVMAEDRFAIECGAQKLEFTESGLKIDSKNFETTITGDQTTKVSGQVEETASGSRTIKAFTLSLVGQPINLN